MSDLRWIASTAAATLCLATTGFAQAWPSAKEITASLDLARPALHKHLRQNRGDVLALLCLAALHDDLKIDDRHFKRALLRLDRSVLNGTYGAALRLMVMAENPLCFGTLSPAKFNAKVARDAKRILRNRFHGGFTYAKRNSYWDLSNTQYAALGLRGAQSLGFVVPTEIWEGMLKTVLKVQTSTGGFGYTRNNRRKRAYASMTVAGIAILQICKQHLPATSWKPRKIDAALAKAWAWMAQERVQIGSETTLSCLYFHYGLERAAILSDTRKVGDLDWYLEGAGMLIRMQHPKNGSWRSSWEIRPGGLKSPGSPVDTAFAVLFLRRHFQKELPRRYVRILTLTEQSRLSEIQAAAQRAIKRGEAALEDVIKALRSEVGARRQAAAIALAKLSGKDFGFDPSLPPSRSAEVLKAVELWWLRKRSQR